MEATTWPVPFVERMAFARFGSFREPKEAFWAKRFVEEAVVAKKLVEVALVRKALADEVENARP